MIWFKFTSLICAVAMILALLADILCYAAAMLTGGVTIYTRSEFAKFVLLSFWWLVALAIAWPLAGRLHLRPF